MAEIGERDETHERVGLCERVSRKSAGEKEAKEASSSQLISSQRSERSEAEGLLREQMEDGSKPQQL